MWFHLGPMRDNAPHHHFAIQLTLSLDKPFKVHFGNKTVSTHSILIKNSVEHHLDSEQELLIILVNPVSSFGFYLLNILGTDSWMEFFPEWLDDLRPVFRQFFNNKITEKKMMENVGKKIVDLKHRYSIPKNLLDERINRAVGYLEEHSGENVPVEEIATVCSLSEGRFMHLFKEQTGITYRRFQLWNRLLLAGKHILTGKNLTNSAHEAGFADSAHMSRTFKETFGAKCKNIIS